MSQMANVSLDRFRAFVTGDKLKDIQHDQIQLKSNGHLVSVTNTAGDKIQRFFCNISSEGADQVRKNREIRELLLSAIKRDSNGRIPKALIETLKASGFDLSGVNARQSTKSLSSRAIRVILSKYDEIKQEQAKSAYDKALDAVTGNKVKDKVTMETAKTIKETLLRSSNKYMTAEQLKKVEKLLNRMVEADASPNKIARLTFLFTDGLRKAASAIDKAVKPPKPEVPPKPDSEKEPSFPDAPKDPREKPFFSFFWKKPADNSPEVQKYLQDLDKYNKDCDHIREENKGYFEALQAHEKGLQDVKAWEQECVALDKKATEDAKGFVANIFEGMEPTIDSLLKQADEIEANSYSKVLENGLKGNGGRIEIDLNAPNTISKEALDTGADYLMSAAKGFMELEKPGHFDKTTAKVMNDFDKRLEASAKADGKKIAGDFEIVEKPKSHSESAAATVKVDMGKFINQMKDEILGPLKEYVTVGGLDVTGNSGDDKTLHVKLKNVNMTEQGRKQLPGFVTMTGLDTMISSVGDLDIPVHFDVDGDGALKLSIGKVSSEKSEKLATQINNLKDQLGNFVTMKLASLLGADAYVKSNFADKLGRIDEMSVKDSAILSIDADKASEEIISVKIDPSKFGPLQALGFDADTKFGGVRVVGGNFIVQAGGKVDQTGSVEFPDKGALSANVDLAGLADRTKYLLEKKGVKFDSFNMTTDPRTGTVSVAMKGFDAAGALKDMKGLKGKAARLFANGSFKLSFKPELDPRTGFVTLAFAGVESLGGVGNWVKKTFLNQLMRTVAEKVLADNEDVHVTENRDPNAALTLRLRTDNYTRLPPIGKRDRLIKPVGLKVTSNGLAIGLDVVNRVRRDDAVFDREVLPPSQPNDAQAEFNAGIQV